MALTILFTIDINISRSHICFQLPVSVHRYSTCDCLVKSFNIFLILLFFLPIIDSKEYNRHKIVKDSIQMCSFV